MEYRAMHQSNRNATQRTLLALLIAMPMLFGSAQAFAQDPDKYCTGIDSAYECYESLEAAEAAMRSANLTSEPLRQYLVPTHLTTIASDGTITFYYYVPDQPVEVLGGESYVSGAGTTFADGVAALGPCSQATPPSVGCNSEASVVARLEAGVQAEIERSNGMCQAGNYRVEGNYASPLDHVVPNLSGATTPSGAIYFGFRMFKFDYSCGGDSMIREIQISKSQSFNCGADLRTTWFTGADAVGRWPTKLYCKPSPGGAGWSYFGSIVTKVRQVESCAANDHPCIPATGEKVRYEEDFRFAGRKFTRNYHSRREFASPEMPIGWTHSLQERLIPMSDSSYNAYGHINSRGNLETIFAFADSSASEASPSTPSRLRLYRTPSDIQAGLVLRRSDGETKRFTFDGNLTSIVNPGFPSENITLAYENSRLSTATDATGRRLQFVYTDNILTSIVLPNGSSATYGQDVDGNLSHVTIAGGVREYHYSAIPGQLVGITGEDGVRYATFGYDDHGRVTSSHLIADGQEVEKTTLNYISDLNVEVLTDGRGTRQFQIGSNLSRRINSITDSSGTRTFGYPGSASGFPNSHTDANGVVTRYTYTLGRPQTTVRAFGSPVVKQEYTQYGANNLVSQKQVFNGVSSPQLVKATKWAYDSSGAVISECEVNVENATALAYVCGNSVNAPAGVRQTRYIRCSSSDVTGGICPIVGQVKSVDGPRTDVSDVTSYLYYLSDHASCASSPPLCAYRKGDLFKVMNALGHETTFDSYNADGLVTGVTDENGLITSVSYDGRQSVSHHCVGAALPACTGGELTALTYWPTGLLKRVTTPDGSLLDYSYDSARRLIEIRDGSLNRINYTLDPAGNRIGENVYDPSAVLKRTHSRVFNALGRLWKDVNAAGSPAVTTTLGYDNNGNQTTVDAPLLRNSVNGYDELNRLDTITDAASGITAFTYDANDSLKSVTDPRSLVTSYNYNGFGDLATQVSPDTGTTTNTYDSNGNLDTATDARGAVADYSYDALNRVASVSYTLSGVTDQTVSYTYDSGTNQKGRLTGASDALHSMAWAYDSKGRVTGRTHTYTAATPNIPVSVGYGYNPQGQLASLVLPSGKTITYGYNTNNQVTSITLLGSPNVTILSNVTYDPFGPVTGWTWGNGSTVTRSYDTDGKLTDISNSISSIGNRGFGFDDAFRITGVTDSGGGPSWTYEYDDLDRLDAATKSGTIIGYSYDANGNRLTQSGTNASTHTVSATSNRLSSVSGSLTRTYTYDAVGNTLTTGATIHTYNNSGRMNRGRFSSTGTNTNYVYNALGQRIRKGGGTPGTVYYGYDEAGHLLGEYTWSGSMLALVLVQETIWLGDIPVATIRPNGAGVNVFYVHTDQLNTPRKITNTANQLRWKWDPTPFGEGAPDENPASLGTYIYNLRFPGQMFDLETDLNYNYFRDYDPATGRYSKSDPIGLHGGINTYGYVGANPIMGIDPTGLTTLVFDVTNGTLMVDPEVAGRTRYKIDATSGKGNCENETKCERMANKGPIPRGRYEIYPSQIDNPGFWDDFRRNFRDERSEGGGDWGDWRVRIYPLPGTQRFGRTGFYLHGGYWDGSAGCIDIGGGVFGHDKLLEDLKRDPDNKIPLLVQ
jgi:RHS repeat-associated protein